MKKDLRARVVLTSLGFAFYAAPASALPPAQSELELGIQDRLARFHAAQAAGDVRVDFVGQLLERMAAAGESGAKTAQWLQTWNQQNKGGGTPG